MYLDLYYMLLVVYLHHSCIYFVCLRACVLACVRACVYFTSDTAALHLSPDEEA